MGGREEEADVGEFSTILNQLLKSILVSQNLGTLRERQEAEPKAGSSVILKISGRKK